MDSRHIYKEYNTEDDEPSKQDLILEEGKIFVTKLWEDTLVSKSLVSGF